MSGTFDLEQNQLLNVAVGQKGSYECGNGGSFVVLESVDGLFSPLLIAGGAGGDNAGDQCGNASLTEFGKGPNGEMNMEIGSSGKSGKNIKYTGGGGYKSNSSNGHKNDPQCFRKGLVGGISRKG